MKSSKSSTSKKEEWIFTFGSGMPLAGYCVRIEGDYAEARLKMCEKFGTRWAFQYSAEEWEDWERRRPIWVPAEIEIPFEEENNDL